MRQVRDWRHKLQRVFLGPVLQIDVRILTALAMAAVSHSSGAATLTRLLTYPVSCFE